MALDITWTYAFPDIDVAPEHDGHTDVVMGVHWRVTGSIPVSEDPGAEIVSAESYGSFAVEYDDKAPLLYANLTRGVARNLARAALDITAIRRGIKASLKEKMAAVESMTITVPPPWDGGAGGEAVRANKLSRAAAIAAIDATPDAEA